MFGKLIHTISVLIQAIEKLTEEVHTLNQRSQRSPVMYGKNTRAILEYLYLHGATQIKTRRAFLTMCGIDHSGYLTLKQLEREGYLYIKQNVVLLSSKGKEHIKAILKVK